MRHSSPTGATPLYERITSYEGVNMERDDQLDVDTRIKDQIT